VIKVGTNASPSAKCDGTESISLSCAILLPAWDGGVRSRISWRPQRTPMPIGPHISCPESARKSQPGSCPEDRMSWPRTTSLANEGFESKFRSPGRVRPIGSSVSYGAGDGSRIVSPIQKSCVLKALPPPSVSNGAKWSQDRYFGPAAPRCLEDCPRACEMISGLFRWFLAFLAPRMYLP